MADRYKTHTYKKLCEHFDKHPFDINLSGTEVGELFNISDGQARSLRRKYLKERKIEQSPSERKQISKKHLETKEELERLKRELGAALELKKTPQVYRIEKPTHGKSFSTIVILASDWHYEENVIAERVSGLNSFNTKIADKRINAFFSNATELATMMQRETKIDTMVVGLLGDFISGDIHEDIVESCDIRPSQAIMAVMARIIAGIDYLLKNTNFKLILPCHSGNHGRTTKEQYHANESGHSLEWMMYHFLRQYYEKNNRIQFMIGEGYHTYLDINGFIIRFHHGHAMNYGGGIGGITIPAYKAISNWNKGRVANLDCFGHFHTSLEGGNFVSNGSLIGYSPYSVRIKASFEKPTQTLFLINDKHKEVTMKCKIFLEG